MGSKTFAIMGATGHLGTNIVKTLLEKGHQVHSIGRNKEKLKKLQEKGSKTFAGDFEDVTMLSEAFQGADTVFSFLPFSYDLDNVGAYQDNVGEAIKQALCGANVRMVVNLSAIGANQPNAPGDSMKGLYRHEQRLNATPKLAVLHFRPGYFMENLMAMIPLIKNLGFMGSTFRADLLIPMIATRDIGHKAAELLETIIPTSEHSVFEYVGPRAITWTEAATIIGAAIGIPSLKYVQFSYADAERGMLERGMKPNIVKLILEMNEAYNAELILTTQEISVDHKGTTPLEEYAKEFARLFHSH